MLDQETTAMGEKTRFDHRCIPQTSPIQMHQHVHDPRLFIARAAGLGSRELPLQLGSLLGAAGKSGRRVESDVEGGPLGSVRAGELLRRRRHLERRRDARLRHEHGRIEEGGMGDKVGRQRAMCNLSGTWLVQKAGSCHHARNTAQLCLWDAADVGHVLKWDGSFEGNAGEHLELAEPLQTGQKLVLQPFPRSVSSCAEEGRRGKSAEESKTKGAERTYKASRCKKSVGWPSMTCIFSTLAMMDRCDRRTWSGASGEKMEYGRVPEPNGAVKLSRRQSAVRVFTAAASSLAQVSSLMSSVMALMRGPERRCGRKAYWDDWEADRTLELRLTLALARRQSKRKASSGG